jgi:cystathionine gamma-lyase
VSEPARSRGDGTRVLRAGLPEAAQGEPFLPSPVFAAPFHLRGDPGAAEYSYARYGHPTWTRFEHALGELEGAEAVLFASGMAAGRAERGLSGRPNP